MSGKSLAIKGVSLIKIVRVPLNITVGRSFLMRPAAADELFVRVDGRGQQVALCAAAITIIAV